MLWRDVKICKFLFIWKKPMGMILIVMFAIAVSKTIIQVSWSDLDLAIHLAPFFR